MSQAKAQGVSRFNLRTLFAFIIVVAIVVAMMWTSTSSARADELPPGDPAAFQEVTDDPTTDVDASTPADAAPAAPVEPASPAPEPVVETPAAPVEEEVVVETPAESAPKPAAPAEELVVDEPAESVDNTTDAAKAAPAAPEAAPDVVILAAPPISANIYQVSDCVVGLLASGDTTGFFWTVSGPDGSVVLAASDATAVQSGVTYRLPVAVPGSYSASAVYTLDGAPEVVPVGSLNVTCNVPVGEPYVDLSNPTVTTDEPLSAVVGFDYEVQGSATRDVYVDVRRQGSDESVEYRTVSVTGSGTASEEFVLTTGNYTVDFINVFNCGGDCDGRDVVFSLDFTVWDEEEPVTIVADKPTVSGNEVSIPEQEGVEYFDVETGETVTDTTVVPEQGITIGARPSDEDGDPVTGGPWFFAYLPPSWVSTSSVVVYDCTEKAWIKVTFSTEISYVRVSDGVVEERAGVPQVSTELADESEIPEDATIICPPDPSGPPSGGGGDLPSSGGPDNGGDQGGNNGGDKTAVVSKPVKTDTLAATGGSDMTGFLVGSIALLLAGAAITFRRRLGFGATNRG